MGVTSWDTWTTPDVEARDFNRRWIDPVQREHLLAHVAASQRLEHPDVQAMVAGQAFGDTPAEGIHNYRAQLGVEREYVARGQGKEVYVDDRDIANMSLEEFDRHFDANGKPREHVYYFQNRSMRLTDGIDQYSARENQSALNR
jgi:hypothetical protein